VIVRIEMSAPKTPVAVVFQFIPRAGVSKPTRRGQQQPPHSPPQSSPAAGRKPPLVRVSGSLFLASCLKHPNTPILI
jgi:hypothetical protein